MRGTCVLSIVRRRCGPLAFSLLATMSIWMACGGKDTAPPPTGPTTPPPPATSTLSGVVTADPNGRALAGVRVSVVDGPNAGKFATTDASGAYTLASLTRSGFTVRFTASGFAEESRGVTLDRDVRLEIRLSFQTWTLAGAIADDANARPIAGATVLVLDGPSPGRTATSNSGGAFSIAGIIEGGFNIRVTASGYQNLERGVDLKGNVNLDLRLRAVPQAPPPPPPPPQPSRCAAGTGARIIFESQSACGCTRGGSSIALFINSCQVGTLGCSGGSASFDVNPGQYSVNGCDASGSCWRTEQFTLASGQQNTYRMFCSSLTGESKQIDRRP